MFIIGIMKRGAQMFNEQLLRSIVNIQIFFSLSPNNEIGLINVENFWILMVIYPSVPVPVMSEPST